MRVAMRQPPQTVDGNRTRGQCTSTMPLSACAGAKLPQPACCCLCSCSSAISAALQGRRAGTRHTSDGQGTGGMLVAAAAHLRHSSRHRRTSPEELATLRDTSSIAFGWKASSPSACRRRGGG